MPALTPSQLDPLVKKLNEEYQTLLREVREELENSGNQHRIDLLNQVNRPDFRGGHLV